MHGTLQQGANPGRGGDWGAALGERGVNMCKNDLLCPIYSQYEPHPLWTRGDWRFWCPRGLDGYRNSSSHFSGRRTQCERASKTIVLPPTSGISGY
eukprot:5658781-Prymnesium_polylepis.2